MDTKLGGSQLRAEPVGRLSRARTSHCQTSFLPRVIRRKETTVGTSLLSRLDAAETPHLPCLDGQVWFPGVTHRVIKRHQTVRMQSWRTARSLIRLRSTRRSEQTINCVKFARTCQMNTSCSYGDSLKAKMQSLDDEKVALQAAKRQFLPLQNRIEKQKNYLSEFPGRLRRNNSIVWKFYKNGSRLIRNWMQHTRNVDSGCRTVRRKCEGCQSGHFRNPVILVTFQPRPRRTTDHPLSVQMQNMGCHSVVEQLMAAGATDEEVMKISQIMAQIVRKLEGGSTSPEPRIEVPKPACEVVVLDAELPSCIPGYSSMDIEGQEAIKRSLSNAATEKRCLAKKCKQEENVL